MKRSMLSAFAFLFLFACDRTSSDHGISKDSAAAESVVKKDYIPVGDYLKNEIAMVDSTPSLIILYHFRNERSDSSIIKTSEFDHMAKAFLRKELDSPVFENSFTENSFMDRTTGLLNFTYSTKDSGAGLKRVDFLAASTSTGRERMNSVYMEIDNSKKDTSEISKMFWKAGSYFTILRISQPVHGAPVVSQMKIVWGSRD